MEGTMAVVTNWAANFAPRNWAYCNGQTLAIAQNTALFSLLGTTYGGNGQTTFCLPQLQSRTVVGTGQGNGLSNYVLGEMGGTPTVTLNMSNIPPHNHNGNATIALQSNNTVGTEEGPEGNFPGALNAGYNSVADATMAAPTYTSIVGIAGSSVPYSNMAPYLCINYIICMYGIFPSRN
jgi:microcystin-dependent protein